MIVQLVILVHLAHLCLEPKNQHAHQAIVQLVILTLLLKVQWQKHWCQTQVFLQVQLHLEIWVLKILIKTRLVLRDRQYCFDHDNWWKYIKLSSIGNFNNMVPGTRASKKKFPLRQIYDPLKLRICLGCREKEYSWKILFYVY